MAQRSGLISIDSFIDKLMLKWRLDSEHEHRVRVIAADGLRELSIYHMTITKTTTLTIDADNLTSDYPSDYVDYVFVAVEKDGKWWTFTKEDKMVDKTITGITGYDLGEIDVVPGFGATGGENDYYFNTDDENRRFLFSGVTSSNVVVLRYISTGVEAVSFGGSSNIQFPVEAEDPMELYIRWKLAEYDGFPGGECERRKDHYEEAVLMMRNLNMPTIDEIRDIWAKSSNQTIIFS